ncbi:HNH endonuclease [Janibacter alittae]|uniref:HNH endonuclease n=1 Tax=Janibacter alittae TaxID=3115209 RepID=A0ABZ2ML27_9MICO
MTSWVAIIDSKYPQHWEIAKQHGFWDMTSAHKVSLGDTVYFWQGGGSLVSQCTATSSYVPLTGAEQLPWDDSGERDYKARFTFDLESEAPITEPAWSDLQKQWGGLYPPQFRSFDDSVQEAVLSQYFDTTPVPNPYRDQEREEEMSRLGLDLRTFDLRSIARRQGQKEFRNKLMRAYGNRCAVTGTSTEFVLEAAHISRFLGAHTNRTNNGLLLRADIHTLFDLHRITVTPGLLVRVDQSLGTPYVRLDSAQLRVPVKPVERPLAAKLAEHNAECSWL